MLQSSQLRAARALLGWRQEDLAQAANVGLATLARIEQGAGVVQGNFSTIMKLQSTLELQGISFINEPGGYGVRLDLARAASPPPKPAKPQRRRRKRSG
jgi:transcriptional regulator with XRE-family HTH domain